MGGYSDERESIEYYRALREEESGKFCFSPPPPQVIDNDGSLSTNCETGERQSYLRGLLFSICVILAVW